MFARLRKWKPVISVVQAVGTWTAIAINFIIHWGLLIAVLGTLLAVLGQVLSPRATDAAIAGLLAFAALQVTIWQLRLRTEVSTPARTAEKETAVAPPEKVVPVNLNALKTQTKWDTLDLAKILAALDQSGQTFSSAMIAWQQAILDAMKHGKLKYVRVPVSGHYDRYYLPTKDSEMLKQDAIQWAETIGFDMEQLK